MDTPASIIIDVSMPAVRFQELRQEAGGESSDAIRARVIKTRERQLERFQGEKIYCHAQTSMVIFIGCRTAE